MALDQSLIIGIDPGANGAVAFLWPDRASLSVVDMPTFQVTRTKTKTFVDEGEVSDLIAAYGEPSHAWIEEVHSMPGDGNASAFSFGLAYGTVLGALGALKVPRSKVAPSKWKTQMKAPADKRQSVARARQLMPNCTPLFTGPRGGEKDGRAEAAMLALYGALQLGFPISRPLRPLEDLR